MKKTATILALAGLSMAAKTDHSFLGRKPVEIKADIDPKMIIKPAHDIDPGMVRKPHRNIDPGMVIKSKKTQNTILTADDNDDELLSIYRPADNIDPGMVRRPPFGSEIDPKFIIKPKKTQGNVLYADDNDDELLLIYRPADNIDPGMVRRPPFGSEIDPKFVIKPPRGFDDGIYVRPRPRGEPVWVDDEMRLVGGTEVDPGMVIKPRRGDIDPGMIRKPVKGWEIDPKIFVKPKRSDVLYADDDEMMVRRPNSENVKYDDELVYASSRIDPGMVRRPPHGNIDQGIIRRPKDNIKYFDAENDDELAVVGHVREPRYIGDFPLNWPGKPVYADAEDDELAYITAVSDPIIHGKHEHDDELVYASTRIDPGMVRKPYYESVDDGIWKRPMGNVRYFDAENDDELAVFAEKPKTHVREPRMIGDFPINWPGKPVYADAEDDELWGGIQRSPYADAVSDNGISMRPSTFKGRDDELAVMTEFVREPRVIGETHGKSSAHADDELILFADTSLGSKSRKGIFDPRELTKPWYQQQQTMYADDADNEMVINDLKMERPEIVNRVKPPKRPVMPRMQADDELIMFADKSLDARLEKRRMPFDLKELTKPWYEQQHTMYADDSLVALGELLEDN